MSRIQHEKQNLSISEIHKIFDYRMKDSNVQFDLDWTTATLFMSKKHYVLKIALNTLCNQNPIDWRIIKIYNERITDYDARWNRECENYAQISKLNTESEMFQKLRIPHYYPSPPGLLLLEYIPGKNLDEILDLHQFTPIIAAKFAQWLNTLHHYGYVFGDQRLGNFLYSDWGEIYAVDLEELDHGDPVDDLAGFLEAFLDYKSLIFENQIPEYPVQIMLGFLDSYLLSNEEMRSHFHQNREIIRFFRNFLRKHLRKVANRRNYSFTEKQENLIMDTLEHLCEQYPFQAISGSK